MKLTIGVTGHRDLVENEMPALREKVRAFLMDLDAGYPGLDLQLLSPLAEGSDQLVAEIARELGIPLIVPLAIQQHEYEKDFGSDSALQLFRSLLKDAEVIPLPLLPGNSAAAVLVPGTARGRQYAQLGVFISNHCQVLLALWNGKTGEQTGGTAGVVNYHLTAVMPGFSVAEESPNLLADNENDLAYHIVVSRQAPGGEPAAGLQALDANWLSSHFVRGSPHAMPDQYRGMLSRLQEFNSDLDKYQAEIERESFNLLDEAPALEKPGGADFVHRLFRHADWLAIHFQKRVNQGMIVTHSLAVVMGLVFILYSEYDGPQLLVYLFLLFFGAGVVFHQLGSRHGWHRKYLDYRALAEGLRVQLYWSLAGVVETHSAVFAYDNFLQKQDVDLGWIRHVMRSASLRQDRTRPPDERWVNWVAAQWVGSLSGDQGQLAYYQQKSQLKTETFRKTMRLGNISLWTGIFIAAVLAVAAGQMTIGLRHVLLIFMGVLPLLAGVRDAYSHKKAERELIKQYRFMSKVFANARRLLDSSPDLAFRRRILMAVGNAALEEHAEWILMHRERPLEHGGL